MPKTQSKKERKNSAQAITIVNNSVLEPEMENNKFTLPKTWVSEKQVMKLIQKTPREHVYSRPAKGGGQWEYVTGIYVKKVLNFVFGWLWDFKIINEKVYGLEEGWGQITVQGELTVKDGRGNTITKTQYGRAEVKYKKNSQTPLDIGNDFKAAATDALKKCASELGIASDIYGKNEFRDIDKPLDENSSKETSGDKKDSLIDQIACNNCAVFVTKAEEAFSKQKFNNVLCRDCQKQVNK